MQKCALRAHFCMDSDEILRISSIDHWTHDLVARKMVLRVYKCAKKCIAFISLQNLVYYFWLGLFENQNISFLDHGTDIPHARAKRGLHYERSE